MARLAAQYVGASGHVTGLDINPGMLAVARSLAPAQGATVEWREEDAMTMPFSDETFDVAFCQLGLQYFAERPQALVTRDTAGDGPRGRPRVTGVAFYCP